MSRHYIRVLGNQSFAQNLCNDGLEEGLTFALHSIAEDPTEKWLLADPACLRKGRPLASPATPSSPRTSSSAAAPRAVLQHKAVLLGHDAFAQRLTAAPPSQSSTCGGVCLFPVFSILSLPCSHSLLQMPDARWARFSQLRGHCGFLVSFSLLFGRPVLEQGGRVVVVVSCWERWLRKTRRRRIGTREQR